MSFAYFLRRAARYWGDHAAVLHRKRCLTYRQLDERSTRLANALLGLGLKKGDRVAVQSRNCVELVEVECALYKAGLVKAALNPRFTAAEAADVVENCEPRVMIAGAGYTGYSYASEGFNSVERFVSIGAPCDGYSDYETLIAQASAQTPDIALTPDDLAVLHFSSGSTGKIKAAMQSYGNRLASLRKMLLSMDSPAGPGDRLALIGPITHASGMLMQPYLYCGATLVLFETFEPAHFFAEVERLRITHVFMVPAMINMLLNDPALAGADLRSLKTLGYGAAPMAPARIQEAWERIGPILSQGYGASESTSGVTRLSMADHAHALAKRLVDSPPAVALWVRQKSGLSMNTVAKSTETTLARSSFAEMMCFRAIGAPRNSRAKYSSMVGSKQAIWRVPTKKDLSTSSIGRRT